MIDVFDRMIIHCLSRDIRMPFAQIGSVIGLSEQTVARRYQMLVGGGVIQCTALVDPVLLGGTQALLRITPLPGRGGTLAAALAQHPDMSWVSLASSEVICVHRSENTADQERMLIDRLPKTSLVQSFSAHLVISRYPITTELFGASGLFSAEQLARLDDVADPDFAMADNSERDWHRVGDPPVLTATDREIIAILARDARMPFTRIASRVSLTPTRVASRIKELVADGALYLDVDLANTALGSPMAVIVFGRVPSRLLPSTGAAIGAIDEVTFVCATTGASNLMASIQARDTLHLHTIITEKFGAIPGTDDLEFVPILQQIKQARAVVDDARTLISLR